MASPNFPSTGLVPNETKFTVGALTYLWDGEKWRTITAKLSADQITYDSSKTVKEAIDSKLDNQLTTTQLINQSVSLADGKSIRTNGFYVDGDGGGAQWVKTSDTGTPSQTPAQLGDAKFTDASGNVWDLANGQTVYYNGEDLIYPLGFGDYGEGLYSYNEGVFDYIPSGNANTILGSFSELSLMSPSEDGESRHVRFICPERANAEYLLQPSGYAALVGDVTFANGRVGELQINGNVNVLNFSDEQESIARGVTLLASIIINVPTDAATLQDAVDISRSLTGVADFSTVEIRIESSYQPADGIIVESGDYSNIIITSAESIVTVGAAFPDSSSFIKATNAQAPTLGCAIDMNNLGEKGYHLERNSSGRVMESCGVNKAGGKISGEGTGLFLDGASKCTAKYSIFNGSYRNIWAAHESSVYADFANADGATGDAGVYCARASRIGISYGSVKNCAGNGLRARRAYLLCMAVDASGNGTGGAGYGILAAEGATVVASQGGGDTVSGANLSNNKQGAINADASVVIARNSDLTAGINTGPSNAVVCTSGSTVNVTGSDMRGISTNNYERGIASTSSTVIAKSAQFNYNANEAIRGFFSVIDLSSATITGSQRGISAQQGTRVNASGANITSNTIHGVLAQGGSFISLDDATVTGSSTTDIRIEEGGQVAAHGCTTTAGGTPSLSNTNVASFNSIYSTGIVFA